MVALLVLKFTCGCAAPPGASGEWGDSSAKIADGTLSTPEQDAVVRIDIGNSRCTGTLLAENLVLTAKHCVRAQIGTTPCLRDGVTSDVESVLGELRTDGISVFIGRTAKPLADALAIEVIDTGPGALCGDDLALVLLDHRIAGAKVADVSSARAERRSSLTAVGWGRTGASGPRSAYRLQRPIEVIAVGPFMGTTTSGVELPVFDKEFAGSEGICTGDSGGPLLNSVGKVVGIVSRGPEPCETNHVIAIDAAAHRTFIAGAIAKAKAHVYEVEREP